MGSVVWQDALLEVVCDVIYPAPRCYLNRLHDLGLFGGWFVEKYDLYAFGKLAGIGARDS